MKDELKKINHENLKLENMCKRKIRPPMEIRSILQQRIKKDTDEELYPGYTKESCGN